MPIELTQFVDHIRPSNTVLLFGSGSSIPSGAPSTVRIVEHLSKALGFEHEKFTLAEIASLVEKRDSRRRLISERRTLFAFLRPSGGLLNLPLYDWKSLYTTNYDELIEETFRLKSRDLRVYSSNFDFTIKETPAATRLFKLHGTINTDIADGHHGRMIITEADYDLAQDYREALFDTFKVDLHSAQLVIIGHSLADPDIREIVNRAIAISQKAQAGTNITLLLYTRDENRAELFETRGLRVCFGSIDDFFAELAKKLPHSSLVYKDSDDPLERSPRLRPITVDVSHALKSIEPNVSAMFNGWSATYADIVAGLTFERSVVDSIENYLKAPDSLCATVLGASGVGKTTAARQAVYRLSTKNYFCWEHKDDYSLLTAEWRTLADRLKNEAKLGLLLVDDAQAHLHEINELVDLLVADNNSNLKLILVAPKNQWNPRVKTPNIFKRGKRFDLSQLDSNEILNLLNLIDTNSAVQGLVEYSFAGFSRAERQRRLTVRCEADMFVCLKNIFASEKFDDIILREFASIPEQYQEIYRLVAAMESSGVKVHRQFVVRILGINAGDIPSVLTNLTDIVHEYSINEREGIYAWQGRHPVITDIITNYKFRSIDEFVNLFSKIIDNTIPTYEIEIRTIRQLCNIDSGIGRIPNKEIRNRLLRKMISVVPGERIPRHRLIRNLIDMAEFEKADTEIRLFDNDFRIDGPVYRYKIILLLARAEKAAGIMEEDRLAILDKAREMAIQGIEKFPNNKDILRTYCDVGLALFKRNGNYTVFDAAMKEMKTAETRIGDPEITRLIATYERIISGQEIRRATT
jgi:hypothetical protein